MDQLIERSVTLLKDNEIYSRAILGWIDDGDEITDVMMDKNVDTYDKRLVIFYKKIISNLFIILNTIKLSSTIIVYHGTNNKKILNLKVGDKMSISTFNSTSVCLDIAEDFGDIIMKIKLNIDTPCFYVSAYNIIMYGKDINSEHEILLLPGTYESLGIDDNGHHLFSYSV
jgi:hypothetical protein